MTPPSALSHIAPRHPSHASLFSLLLGIALSGSLSAQTATIAPSSNGMRIEIDGALFTEYVTRDITNPCFYPIIGASGAGLTREYPPAPGAKIDHPHHRSLWIGHDGVNDVNFWFTSEACGRVENTGFADVRAEGNRASFSATSKWVKPDGELVLNDRRHFVITALPDGVRQLDLSVTFLATAGKVTFRDTKEGTVGIRVAPSLTLKGNRYQPEGGRGHILTSAGITDAATWGTRAEWVAYYGPDPKGEPVSIVMMDHPRNLRHPTWWHVRNYGLFAANPFGQSDFERPLKPGEKDPTPAVPRTKGNYVLAAGQSFTQRYRFLFQPGEPNPAQLNTVFAAFSATE